MAAVGICGGDARNCYLAQLLAERGYTVWTFDLPCERMGDFHPAESLEELAENVQVLVGATPLARYVIPGCTVQETEERFRRAWKKDQYFFAGGISAGWQQKAEEAGVHCIDFLKQSEYQEQNAKLTAEGTLCEALLAYPGGLAGSRVLVSGYGCCGRAIAKQFLCNGAKVTVCVRRMESAWQATQDGMEVCYFEYVKEIIGTFDLIINTVPACVFAKECVSRINPKAQLLEIASGEGGFEPEAVKAAGLSVRKCPGLPGKYAPLCCAQGMLGIIEKCWNGAKSSAEMERI